MCLCYKKRLYRLQKRDILEGLVQNLCFQPPSRALQLGYPFHRRTGEGKKGWFSGTLLAEVPPVFRKKSGPRKITTSYK